MARPKTDFTNVKCCMCDKGNLTSKTAYREYEEGIWRGRWLCTNCWRLNPNNHLDTKGGLLNEILDGWTFGSERKEKEFDYLICYCANKNGKIIKRIYIIPKEEVIKRRSIGIMRHPSKSGWYEKYRIDNNIVRNVNEIFKEVPRP